MKIVPMRVNVPRPFTRVRPAPRFRAHVGVSARDASALALDQLQGRFAVQRQR